MGKVIETGLHFLGAAVLLTAGVGAWGQDCLLWDYAHPSLPKQGESKLEYEGMCYEITSGRPNLLDCHFLMQIRYAASGVSQDELLDYAGGHLHPPPCGMEPSRPVGRLAGC